MADMVWVQPTYNGSPSCAFCGTQQHQHEDDCLVIEMLRKDPRTREIAELADEAVAAEVGVAYTP